MNDELERLMDSSSVGAMLTAMADICEEKADHIRENWQDKPLSECWDEAASSLRVLAGKSVILNLE